MCTATWIRTRGGYEVFFNRDELATRKPALPPSEHLREGVRFLAPVDGDAGGTWIGVNERGIAVGLANGDRGATQSGVRDYRSRGLVVLDLLASRSLADVERRLSAVDPSIHRPFELFSIDRGGEAAIWSSDGKDIARRAAGAGGDAGGALLFSSSRDAERARRERQALLDRRTRAQGGLDAELLAAFHASHEPERGAFSPCMHREEARTVSFTRIRVGEREVEMEYRPGSPCEPSTVARANLALETS